MVKKFLYRILILVLTDRVRCCGSMYWLYNTIHSLYKAVISVTCSVDKPNLSATPAVVK